MTRLPATRARGTARIALTTGGADALECLLRKIGISDSEFTPESGTGRVNFFAGVDGANAFDASFGGAMFTPVNPWWNDVGNLNRYDMILHSCEGTENPTNKSQGARMALQQYANAGGRVFARTGTTTGSSSAPLRGRGSPTSITRRTSPTPSRRRSTPASTRGRRSPTGW